MYSRCRIYHFVKWTRPTPGPHRPAEPGGPDPPDRQRQRMPPPIGPFPRLPPRADPALATLQVAGFLEGHEVLGRQLFAFLEPLEDHLRLPPRVHLDRRLRGHPAALHPDPVDDLVVVVDLADALDVLAVLLVGEHLRLDELLLRMIRLPSELVALLVQRRHAVVLLLRLLREFRDALVRVLRPLPPGTELIPH